MNVRPNATEMMDWRRCNTTKLMNRLTNEDIKENMGVGNVLNEIIENNLCYGMGTLGVWMTVRYPIKLGF